MSDIILPPLNRIVIIEDDSAIRESYAYLLDHVEGFEVIGTYASVEDSLDYIKENEPDIILLDIELPGMSGIDALPKIKQAVRGVKVIILTAYEDPQLIFGALSNGASGYLSKSIPAARLVESIQDIIVGGGSLSAGVAKLVIEAFRKNTDSPLSRREGEILQMISDGKSRSMIAKELYIDLETVKTHIKNVYLKLDVHSRADAIRIGREKKFIR